MKIETLKERLSVIANPNDVRNDQTLFTPQDNTAIVFSCTDDYDDPIKELVEYFLIIELNNGYYLLRIVATTGSTYTFTDEDLTGALFDQFEIYKKV